MQNCYQDVVAPAMEHRNVTVHEILPIKIKQLQGLMLDSKPHDLSVVWDTAPAVFFL